MLPPLSSQRNRSTTRTKVYLSQVAFAQIRQSMAFETASRHFWTNAFPDENGCKSVVDLPNGHFSSNYKTGKKNMLSFPSGFENLEDSCGNSLQVCSESAHKHHGTHQKPLTLHLTSGACSLGIFQRLSRTCKTKDERTHTKMNDVNKFK